MVDRGFGFGVDLAELAHSCRSIDITIFYFNIKTTSMVDINNRNKTNSK